MKWLHLWAAGWPTREFFSPLDPFSSNICPQERFQCLHPTFARNVNTSFESQNRMGLKKKCKSWQHSAAESRMLSAKASSYIDVFWQSMQGGSVYTPNMSFQWSSQPTHKQETDEQHISTWGNSVFQPLKMKTFLIDLVCISIARWRGRSEQPHPSCVSSGNTREHWLLRKMTRKALSIPLQQMGCDNRPEAIRPALILHLLPSTIAPQTETKLHHQTEACAPSIKSPALTRQEEKQCQLVYLLICTVFFTYTWMIHTNKCN